jgi:hypothetical protein
MSAPQPPLVSGEWLQPRLGQPGLKVCAASSRAPSSHAAR